MKFLVTLESFLIFSLVVTTSISLVCCVHGSSRDRSSKERNDQEDLEEPKALNNVEDYAIEDDEDEGASNKFSWKHHQEGHGVYSGRALMSTQNIRHEVEDVEEDWPDDKNETRRNEEEDLDPLKTIDYVEKEWLLMFRSLDLRAVSLIESVVNMTQKQSSVYDNIIRKLKPECRRAIYHLGNSVKRHRLWALQMVDSNGKVPSGVSYGRFSSPGDYLQCLGVKVDEHVYRNASDKQGEHFKFRGKYCLLDFRLPLPERPQNKLLSIHDPVLNLTSTKIGKTYPMLTNYSGYASVFYEIGYLHAFCIPSVCDVTELTRSMSKSLEGLFITVNNTVDCEERFDEPLPYRKSQLISLILLAVVFVNAAIASLLRYIVHNNLQKQTRVNQQAQPRGVDSKLQQEQNLSDSISTTKPANLKTWFTDLALKHRFYSECFSVQRNFERLTKPDPRGLTFVHYTRIVAMALTVVTHTAGMGTLQAITKPADASYSEAIFRDFIPQMLANAFTSIQIFFFMAGFMLVISTYPSIKRDKGHISFVEYAIKRAIRLLPGLTATICLNFLWPLVVEGPMLTYFIRVIVEPCESNWWRTMAFLSNFDHVEKMCLRHSYFSASDYQLHVMAFPLLILLYKKPTVALVIAGLLTVAGFVAQVLMVLTKTLLPFMMIDYLDKQAFFNVVHYIHHPVWNHMSAFFYGFIIGYFVVRQIRIELSGTTQKRIWIILMPLGVASIYAPYYWNHYKRPIFKWQMVIYVIVDRAILLTTCAWLSYATMVLARKPSPKAVTEKNAKLNLPNIVTLEQDSKKQREDTAGEPVGKPISSSLENRPKLAPPSGTITRQRSSPDFQNLAKQYEAMNGEQLNRAASSVDITKLAPEKLAEKSAEAKEKPAQLESTPEAQTKPRSKAPVSNVNTLCLVLSRLTFQLYLFNMVVLWVDVNHSKYLWYFSYYFIITKSFCVYIYSSIMALIFFVLLESPSLTLYIAWVKSRAAKRAARTSYDPMSRGMNARNENEHVSDKVDRILSNSSDPSKGRMIMTGMGEKGKNFGGSFDGLCMKPSAIQQTTQQHPTFSFIDLSTADSQSDNKIATKDQTKM